jgi:hypothetical protein
VNRVEPEPDPARRRQDHSIRAMKPIRDCAN